jgi:hypothetical protein
LYGIGFKFHLVFSEAVPESKFALLLNLIKSMLQSGVCLITIPS